MQQNSVTRISAQFDDSFQLVVSDISDSMGTGASVFSEITNEKHIALYREMKAEYENNRNNGKSDEENFEFYKRKYEQFLEVDKKTRREISLKLGDIVACGADYGEGIIVDQTDHGYVVDIGRPKTVELPFHKVKLILGGLEYEVGDKVQVRPEGMLTYFYGHVKTIHPPKSSTELPTYDVEMMGVLDDIEEDVRPENMRKIMSCRLIRKRMRKLVNTLHAAVAFGGFSASSNDTHVADAKGGEVKGVCGGSKHGWSGEDTDQPLAEAKAEGIFPDKECESK